MNKRILKDKSGFTLLEALLAVALSSLLMLVVYVTYFSINKSIEAATESGIRFVLSGFVGMTAGYLVQDLSGWMEIALTPFFWILIGLGIAFSTDNKGQREKHSLKTICMYVLLGLISIGLIYLIFDAINRIYANRLFWQAQQMSPARDWKQIEHNINEGLSAMAGDFYHEDMAGILYLKRFNESGDKDAYDKGAKLLEKAHKHNPYDVYVMIHRLDIETLAIKKGIIQKPSDSVQGIVSKMLEMDRNNPTVYESAIKLRLEEKKYNEVLKLIQRARELHPEEIKYYIMEGNMYRATGEDAKATASLKKGIAIAEESGTYSEDWANAKYTLAGFYLNKKAYDKALSEVEEVKKHLPGNINAYLMTGDIYGVTGNFEKSRDSFNAALKIDPNNQNARKGLEQIKQITGK